MGLSRVMQLLAGEESNKAAHLGDAGATDFLDEHVLVVRTRPAPVVELFERAGGTTANIFNAQTTVALLKTLVKSEVAKPFLLEHREAVGAGRAGQGRIQDQ